MFGRISRMVCVTVVAVAFSGIAAAQQPAAKPEAKPEAKAQEKPAAKPEVKKEEGKDLVAVAGEAKCKTLCELVKLAGLEDALKGPVPMTLFAPTDEAFAKLGKDLDELKKPENKAKLADILKYHVVKGKLMAEQVGKEKALKTLLPSAEIAVAMKDGKCTLNDKAAVTKADMAASNGVVHLIDTVLTPPEKKPEPKLEAKPAEKKPEAKPEAKPAEKKPEAKPGDKKG